MKHSFLIKFKLITAAALTLSLSAGPVCGNITAYAHSDSESRYLNGTWEKDENGWWFRNSGNPEYYTSTWVEYQGNSYYFGYDGYLVTGWQYINKHWYYFNPYEGKYEGSMMTGWILDSDYNGWFYLDQSGIMVTGWRKIDGYWYYFNTEADRTEGVPGMMAVNRVVDDSYVDMNGRMNEIR